MVEEKEYVIDAERQKLMDWNELWTYRELFYFFAWRDIKIRYKQTVFGFLWAVIQPLALMAIFTVFFGKALNIPSQNLPYPVFVFSGLILWTMFSSGLTGASNSMVNNALIIKKVYFPKLVIPVSALFVALFDFLVTLVLFVGMLIVYRQPVSYDLIWCWPMAILITMAATLGPGNLLAALNVKYRDFRFVIPFLVQVVFFLTPVIYPVSFLKYPGLQYFLACNPMYSAIELFRSPLTPEVALNEGLIVLSLSTCSFFLLTGLVYFKKTEDFFADLA